jgi:transcriptional regulator with XRE-family HTH domain
MYETYTFGEGIQYGKDRNVAFIHMTGAQLRAARALLGWSAQELADASGVGVTTIRKNELLSGQVSMIRSTADAVTRALNAAGVEFIPENGGGAGVRLKKPSTPV